MSDTPSADQKAFATGRDPRQFDGTRPLPLADTQTHRTLAAIPARWGSTRFPGKPLHPIAGKPLVQHVWERAMRCKNIDQVVIATDDERIMEAAASFGAQAVLTAVDHPSGTDRIAEVARAFPDHQTIINTSQTASS